MPPEERLADPTTEIDKGISDELALPETKGSLTQWLSAFP